MSKIIPLRQPQDDLPNTVNGKVPPKRSRNKDVRTREHLTEKEVTELMAMALT